MQGQRNNLITSTPPWGGRGPGNGTDLASLPSHGGVVCSGFVRSVQLALNESGYRQAFLRLCTVLKMKHRLGLDEALPYLAHFVENHPEVTHRFRMRWERTAGSMWRGGPQPSHSSPYASTEDTPAWAENADDPDALTDVVLRAFREWSWKNRERALSSTEPGSKQARLGEYLSYLLERTFGIRDDSFLAMWVRYRAYRRLRVDMTERECLFWAERARVIHDDRHYLYRLSEVDDAFLNGEWSTAEMAEQLGITQRAVRNLVRRCGPSYPDSMGVCWIESKRSGRRVTYHLTARGREVIAEVRTQIHACTSTLPSASSLPEDGEVGSFVKHLTRTRIHWGSTIPTSVRRVYAWESGGGRLLSDIDRLNALGLEQASVVASRLGAPHTYKGSQDSRFSPIVGSQVPRRFVSASRYLSMARRSGRKSVKRAARALAWRLKHVRDVGIASRGEDSPYGSYTTYDLQALLEQERALLACPEVVEAWLRESRVKVVAPTWDYTPAEDVLPDALFE